MAIKVTDTNNGRQSCFRDFLKHVSGAVVHTFVVLAALSAAKVKQTKNKDGRRAKDGEVGFFHRKGENLALERGRRGEETERKET